MEPIKLPSLTPVLLASKQAELTSVETFWSGMMPNSPIGSFNAAGVDFHTYVDPQQNVSGDMLRERRPGVLREHSRETIERAIAIISKRVMRVRPDGTGDIWATDDKHYSPQSNDEPLAKYLYLLHAPSGKRGVEYPPPSLFDLQQAGGELSIASAELASSTREKQLLRENEQLKRSLEEQRAQLSKTLTSQAASAQPTRAQLEQIEHQTQKLVSKNQQLEAELEELRKQAKSERMTDVVPESAEEAQLAKPKRR